MRGIVRQMLAGKARELDAEADRLQTRLAELTATETQHAQMIHEQEAEQDRLSQRIYALDAEIRQEPERSDSYGARSRPHRKTASHLIRRAAPSFPGATNRSSWSGTRWPAARGMETRNSAQLQAVENARRDSITVSARVEELTAQATHRAAQIPKPRRVLDALRRVATQAGESLLRLHGEQKQAEEALVHQNRFDAQAGRARGHPA